MKLDLSSLEKAIDSMERSLAVSKKLIKGKVNTDEEEVIRAGVIQNFEFTYELCWKFIQRWLEINFNPEVSGLSRKELYRAAFEKALINNPEIWFEYHAARNKTAHTYDAKEAEAIFETAKKFISDAKALLNVLENKND